MMELVIYLDEINAKLLNNLINRCPATILAVKRTDSVIGRIMLLINSIITMKFISGVGVPVGTMWITMLFVLLNHPCNIIESHIIRAVENEIDICAVGVKIKGNKAITFKISVTIKIDLIMIIVPFLVLGKIKFSISFLIKELIIINTLLIFILLFHFNSVKSRTGVNRVNQDMFIIDDDGSKIENKLLIIFKLFLNGLL